MSPPSQPVLTPRSESPDTMSPLALPRTPASPASSDISLEALSLGDVDSDWSATASSAGTDDSCTSACCENPAPPPPHKADPSPPATTSERVLATVPEEAWSPLVIIGAGPHALALATRLNEPRPAALYTDLEHARLSWLQRDAAAAAFFSPNERRNAKSRHKAVKGHWPARKLVVPKEATLVANAVDPAPSIRVLDSSGNAWLSRWDAFFAGLSIQHLRSPMTFHPSPADADALVAYAQRTAREPELEPIKGVVGSELSKYQRKKRRGGGGGVRNSSISGTNLINERDRQDYQRPSTALFRDFVQDDLVARYPVPQVEHTTVTSVAHGLIHVQGDGARLGFVIDSVRADGTPERHAAEAVVMAVGPSSVPAIPEWLLRVTTSAPPSASASVSTGPEPDRNSKSPWDKAAICGRGWCHSAAFAVPGCRPLEGPLGEKVRRGDRVRVCVIGGGLTSAQIVDSLLAQGVSSVVLLVRSRIKTKHFDFDLEWVSKYNNLRKMEFFQEADPYERFEQVRSSRNGGSVNPTFARILKQHDKSGRLEICTMTEVEGAAYDADSDKWTLDTVTKLDPPKHDDDDDDDEEEASFSRRRTFSDIDFVVASTGSKLDFATGVDFLAPLARGGLVPETVHGLPVLTHDLQLSPSLPFFVLGAYAMLELGPDALNLSGTRAGAERVAHRLGELGIFERYSTSSPLFATPATTLTERMRAKQARSGGEGNYFEGLGEVDA